MGFRFLYLYFIKWQVENILVIVVIINFHIQKSSLRYRNIGGVLCQLAYPVALMVKKICLQRRRPRFYPAEKSWKREWQPTQVFLSGKSRRQRSLMTTIHWVARSRTQLKGLTHTQCQYHSKGLGNSAMRSRNQTWSHECYRKSKYSA